MKRILLLSLFILSLAAFSGCKKNTVKKLSGTWERYFIKDPVTDPSYTSKLIKIKEVWTFDDNNNLTIKTTKFFEGTENPVITETEDLKYELDTYRKIRVIDPNQEGHRSELNFKIQTLNDEVLLLILYNWATIKDETTNEVKSREFVVSEFYEFSKLQ